MKFYCFGHTNVLAEHTTTLEITKDSFLTKAGDCIVGVRAEFDFIPKNVCKVIISVGGLSEEIVGIPNPSFCSNREIVLRKSKYRDDRTLMINCNKAASDLSREFVAKLQKGYKVEVRLCEDK